VSNLPRMPVPGLTDVWVALNRNGYAVTRDHQIGISANAAVAFRRSFFTPEVLRHDDGDWPVDRLRARDVIRYTWQGEDLSLQEYETITIIDRGGIIGKRDHSRVWLIGDPHAEEIIRALLCLVPPSRRDPDGTLGLNLFRTFTNVVTRPHNDQERFVILYILARVGEGAETYLYESDDVPETGPPTAAPVFRYQLNPGEIIIVEDERFKHGATPLEGPYGGRAMRDALVCTVDCRETYLAPGAAT